MLTRALPGIFAVGIVIAGVMVVRLAGDRRANSGVSIAPGVNQRRFVAAGWILYALMCYAAIETVVLWRRVNPRVLIVACVSFPLAFLAMNACASRRVLRSLTVHLLPAAMTASLGCGSGSQSMTSPSPGGPANVAGVWAGTLTFNGTLSQGPITMTLTQSAGATSVSGTWSAENEWSGTIDGSVSGSTFAGQLVWNYTATGQAHSKCSATLTLLGNAGGNLITWTSSSINRAASSVFCDLGVASLRIDATK